jgi:hypothetical protein
VLLRSEKSLPDSFWTGDIAKEEFLEMVRVMDREMKRGKKVGS